MRCAGAERRVAESGWPWPALWGGPEGLGALPALHPSTTTDGRGACPEGRRAAWCSGSREGQWGHLVLGAVRAEGTSGPGSSEGQQGHLVLHRHLLLCPVVAGAGRTPLTCRLEAGHLPEVGTQYSPGVPASWARGRFHRFPDSAGWTGPASAVAPGAQPFPACSGRGLAGTYPAQPPSAAGSTGFCATERSVSLGSSLSFVSFL